QCYEGLDVNQAVYEWNYTQQIMHIRYLESQNAKFDEAELFSERFLLKRPLLQAIEDSAEKSQVLLIDEVDRSDEEFEAFLLEILSDFQVTIPEIGTIRAEKRPAVVLTSNRTRELHDALKRRCIYYWIEYPSFHKELDIVQTKVPEASAELARQATAFIQELRREDLYKVPGVAETIDWTTALVALDQQALDPRIVEETLGVILKYQDDVQKIQQEKLQQIYNRAISQ
ncbi:MAG: MoxR family ATPase, partial [Anaerolineales bacterium]|nr:MoxR family ATPase [Anaerolineales bacterium]